MSKLPLLYYTPQSPPCRAVLLTAAALGLDLDLSHINLAKGEHLTCEFLKLNPLHTIPVLVDDGVVITDSHVICSYLADKYAADTALYPKDKIKRLLVDARLYYNCGHIFPRGRLMVESILFHGAGDIPHEKIVYMQESYDGLEKCLTKSRYLCGDSLTIADLCTIATVSTTMLIAPLADDRFPNLKDWVNRMAQLPCYQKANQGGVEMMRTILRAKMEENKRAKQNE